MSSPVESLLGLCAAASTENLRFSTSSLLPPTAPASPSQAGVMGGAMGVAMGVAMGGARGVSKTTADTEPDPDSSSGAQVTLPRLAPLLGLLAAGYWGSTELALALALAATLASALAMGVSAGGVSAGGGTVSCVSVQRVRGGARDAPSPPVFPPMSGNAP